MKMIILGLTTFYEIYFCANFITSNGFVCKNEGESLLVVCLNVKNFNLNLQELIIMHFSI